MYSPMVVQTETNTHSVLSFGKEAFCSLLRSADGLRHMCPKPPPVDGSWWPIASGLRVCRRHPQQWRVGWRFGKLFIPPLKDSPVYATESQGQSLGWLAIPQSCTGWHMLSSQGGSSLSTTHSLRVERGYRRGRPLCAWTRRLCGL